MQQIIESQVSNRQFEKKKFYGLRMYWKKIVSYKDVSFLLLQRSLVKQFAEQTY